MLKLLLGPVYTNLFGGEMRSPHFGFRSFPSEMLILEHSFSTAGDAGKGKGLNCFCRVFSIKCYWNESVFYCKVQTNK